MGSIERRAENPMGRRRVWPLGLFVVLLSISGLAFRGGGNPDKEGQNIKEEKEFSMERIPARSPEGLATDHMDFGDGDTLDFQVFQRAWWGHQKMIRKGRVSPEKQHLITVIDFRLHSARPRLWVLDMNQSRVVFCDYVAHGQGSGLDYAREFSNRPHSHQSSLGFYLTGEIYKGKHGKSLRLHGLEKGINHRALERAIVLHGADYVSESFIQGQRRLGRSWGCPAVSRNLAPVLIDLIAGGTTLFIYAQDEEYLSRSEWIRAEDENGQDRWLAERADSRPQAGFSPMAP